MLESGFSKMLPSVDPFLAKTLYFWFVLHSRNIEVNEINKLLLGERN